MSGGNTRKPRGPKLPISSFSDRLEFTPDGKFWAAVERHAGRLSDEKRAELRYQIDSYYSLIQAHEGAASVSEAETRLAAVKSAAKVFWQTLMSDSPNDANIYVTHLVDRHFGSTPLLSVYYGPADFDETSVWSVPADLEAPVDGEEEEWVRLDPVRRRLRPLSVSALVRVMTEFVGACDISQKELNGLKGERHFQPSDTWARFIEGLGRFWEGLSPQHRVRVSKSSPTPTPFVEFVNAIQFQMEPRFRQYTTGSEPDYPSDALIQAIWAATKPIRAERKGQKEGQSGA